MYKSRGLEYYHVGTVADVPGVLVREGVPLSEIEIIARGESEPLVQTPDGVREARNRRVQIILN